MIGSLYLLYVYVLFRGDLPQVICYSRGGRGRQVCITRLGFRKLARATRLPDNRLLVTYLEALFEQLVQVPEILPTVSKPYTPSQCPPGHTHLRGS